jgi:hypothetical protein
VSDVLKNHKNQTIKDMYALLEKELKPLETLQEKVRKASPPPVSELDKELTESEDPKVVEFREAIQRLEDQVRIAREDAHKHLLGKYKTLSDDELDALKNQYGVQYTRAKKAWGMLHDFGEMMGNTDGVVEALNEIRIPNLKSLGNNTGRTNVGDGSPRPKVTSVTIVRGDGATKTAEKISALVVWAKLKTPDIYREWFATAGTDQWQNISETHTFKVGDCEVTIEPVVDTEDDE